MNKELIERFFNKQCTAEEAERVAAYLKANPLIVEEYVSFNEWKSFVADDRMPEAFWNEVRQNIQKKNKARIIRARLKRFAVAASIILIAGTIYFSLYISKKEPGLTANNNINKVVVPARQDKTIVNNTKKLMQVILQDSSVAELSPGAVLIYPVPFDEYQRDITLEGEAKFHVAKNKKKPFTVYAGVLATTALGTVFTVKKSTAKNNISVKLFEGKVVIHAAGNNIKGWNKDVYLLPGEQLNFNESSSLLAVTKISNDSNNSVRKLKAYKHQIEIKTDELIFNNTALPEVMNKLASFYNVKISYNTSLIDTINFTGTISHKDPPDIILKAIGQMNNFEVLKNDNEFIITKHQP